MANLRRERVGPGRPRQDVDLEHAKEALQKAEAMLKTTSPLDQEFGEYQNRVESPSQVTDRMSLATSGAVFHVSIRSALA